jgi:hypothetical protein
VTWEALVGAISGANVTATSALRSWWRCARHLRASFTAASGVMTGPGRGTPRCRRIVRERPHLLYSTMRKHSPIAVYQSPSTLRSLSSPNGQPRGLDGTMRSRAQSVIYAERLHPVVRASATESRETPVRCLGLDEGISFSAAA